DVRVREPVDGALERGQMPRRATRDQAAQLKAGDPDLHAEGVEAQAARVAPPSAEQPLEAGRDLRVRSRQARGQQCGQEERGEDDAVDPAAVLVLPGA